MKNAKLTFLTMFIAASVVTSAMGSTDAPAPVYQSGSCIINSYPDKEGNINLVRMFYTSNEGGLTTDSQVCGLLSIDENGNLVAYGSDDPNHTSPPPINYPCANGKWVLSLKKQGANCVKP